MQNRCSAGTGCNYDDNLIWTGTGADGPDLCALHHGCTKGGTWSIVDGKATCPPVWEVTGEWGTCTTTCGNGTQTRPRKCVQGTCVGEEFETQNCNTFQCPTPCDDVDC